MIRWAPLLLLALAGCNGCASTPNTLDTLRASALRLKFTTGICGGTAIGPNKVLTAKHCLAAGALVSVNDRKVEPGEVVELAADVATIEVTGITFKHIATIGGQPAQGDRVRWFGHPGGASFLFRTGYVVRAWTDEIVIDSQAFSGDSGSGVWDDRGRLIGVLSSMRALNTVADGNLYRIQFAVAIPVAAP